MSETSTHPSNPLDVLRRRRRIMWCFAAPLLIAGACWTFAPLPTGTTDVDVPQLNHTDKQRADTEQPAPIDPSVFAINLWNQPPEASTAQADSTPAPPVPPPPLNIQLIGIITESENGRTIQKAALYDTDNDRLIIVADGERLREQTVRVLAGGVVELSDGQNTRRLHLRDHKEAS